MAYTIQLHYPDKPRHVGIYRAQRDASEDKSYWEQRYPELKPVVQLGKKDTEVQEAIALAEEARLIVEALNETGPQLISALGVQASNLLLNLKPLPALLAAQTALRVLHARIALGYDKEIADTLLAASERAAPLIHVEVLTEPLPDQASDDALPDAPPKDDDPFRFS